MQLTHSIVGVSYNSYSKVRWATKLREMAVQALSREAQNTRHGTACPPWIAHETSVAPLFPH